MIDSSTVLSAARVLLCVRVVCLRGVLSVRASSSMKRGKKAEEAAADGENDTGSGTAACSDAHSNTCSSRTSERIFQTC